MEQTGSRTFLEPGPIATGKLDSLGRVRLDRQALTALGWSEGQAVTQALLPDGSGFVLRLSRCVCAHCGDANARGLIPVRGESKICLTCLSLAQKQYG